MRALSTFSALAVILLGLGCASSPPSDPDPFAPAPGEPTSVETLLDATSRDVIGHPSAVLVYALSGAFEEGSERMIPLSRLMSLTEGVKKAVASDPESARAVAAELLDDKTYLFGRHTRCIFNPHKAVVFEKGKDRVKVLLCFGCREMIFKKAGGDEVMVSFDPGAEALDRSTDRALGQGSPLPIPAP